MKTLQTLLATLALSTVAAAQAEFDHSHAAWTRVLTEHVKGDRVDYGAVKRDRKALDAYVASLNAVTPAQLESWSRNQRYAFWINAYNANTMWLIVENYPLDSIKDLGGLFSPVWKKRFIRMSKLYGDEDEKLSLHEIEHEILRPRFKDARVHAAINCASIGCPPLRKEAFVAERLDEQLDGQVRAWLADRSRNRFDAGKQEVEVSEIFDWFEEDFERDAGGVLNWIVRFAPEKEVEWLRAAKRVKVRHRDYDWSLNDQPKRRD